jgi:hypothetical protein
LWRNSRLICVFWYHLSGVSFTNKLTHVLENF